MMRFAFKKGLVFCEGAVRWTLARMLATNKIQLENEQGELLTIAMEELNQRWQSGTWVLDEDCIGIAGDVFYLATPRDLSTYSEPHRRFAVRRQTYLTRIAKKFEDEGKDFSCTPASLTPKICEVAGEIDDSHPPSWSAVQRWSRRYAPTKCVTKLLDGRSRSGRRQDPVIYGLFEESMMEVFLTPQKRPGKAVFEALVQKIGRLNKGLSDAEKVRCPGPASIYRWLKDLHQGLVMRARLGKAMTARQLRSAIGGVKTHTILERIEIDHTPTNVLVIDTQSKLVLGRPWLTLAIDRHSRMILGFYLSFHGPSAYSVMYCLRQAILPKDAILKRFPDIRNTWPCHGIPDLVATDNGMDLHANAVEALCADLGIELFYCPAGEPQMKGAVERVMRTIAEGLFHELPGTTFSNTDQRGDYDSEKHAAIGLEDLVHIITKWIVDVYNQTPHRGLGGMTPHQSWIDGAKTRVIELPAYPAQLDIITGVDATRTLFHYGIEYDCLRYNSPILQAVRTRTGGSTTVAVRVYEHDVGYVNVLDPFSQEYIRVPAVNADYANGVSRHAHRLITARVASRIGAGWRNADLLNAKTEIQSIIETALRNKKMGTRKRAMIATACDSEQVFANAEDNFATSKKKVNGKPKPPLPLNPGLSDVLPKFGTSNLSPGAPA